MTSPVDVIREALHREPFEPFVITTASGQVYRIRSPDNVAMPPDGQWVFVPRHDGVERLAAGEIVGAYPAEDVAAVALMEADTRGYRRGFDRGARMAFWGGFVAGLLVGVTGSFLYFIFVILPGRFPR